MGLGQKQTVTFAVDSHWTVPNGGFKLLAFVEPKFVCLLQRSWHLS